jgi:hypothetical protein
MSGNQRPFVFVLFSLLLSTLFMTSCSGDESHTVHKSTGLPAGSLPVTSVYDTLSNDIASIISGKASERYINPYISADEWLAYSRQVEKEWSEVTRNKINPIQRWREKNLPGPLADSSALFYPFAGADFLYASTFFPNSSNYILIGLEPVGQLLRCDTMKKKPMVGYLQKIRAALYFPVQLGFFRTESMEKDLNSGNLDGTLPLLAFYIKRTKHVIRNISYFNLDTSGATINCPSGKKAVGVRVDICDTTLTNDRTVWYLSYDLSDQNLKKHKELLAFVKGFGRQNVFLKAASYLMFSPGFSAVRNHVLGNAGVVLQDDSGIPYRFFRPAIWDVTLYGTYTKTINMFEHKFQPDLEEAYKAQEKPHPVPFRIGYNVKFNETNLIFAKRKN